MLALENDFVKSPFKVEKFTDNQVRELALCAQDPVYFIDTYCWVQHPIRGKVRFRLYDYQKDLIQCYHVNRYSINMLGRQMGKTACAAAYLLWYAMFIPDSTILIAAHKYAGAQEIMQRVRYAYETLPVWLKAGVTSYNKGSIDFDNGSRIVSTTTTETTARGMSLSLIYCLEGNTTVKIRNKHTLVEEEISLIDLYTRMYKPDNIISGRMQRSY